MMGIIEYEDEAWFPFKFDTEKQPYEEDYDNFEDDDNDARL